MKIIRLQSQNVMKLVAVDITPGGTLVVVGGRNGAGKTSVLNSIAMALGGKEMCPLEPIRAGESEAKIELDLGDLRVTRRFSRDRFACNCNDEEREKTGQHSAECASRTFGETASTLVVTNKDGARYPSPQALLDKLLGRLTFDPLAFSHEDAKRQRQTLADLTGLTDTLAKIDAQRKVAYDTRAMAKKSLGIKEAQLAGIPKHAGVPTAETPLAEISDEMRKAEEYRRIADDARRDVDRAKDAVTVANDQLGRAEATLSTLLAQVKVAEQLVQDRGAVYNIALKEEEAHRITYDAAVAVIPDVEAIRTKLAEVEATNAKVRANIAWAKANQEVTSIALDVVRTDDAVKQADLDKVEALKTAAFPVPGLGLTDDGVTLNGLPFSQASTAEQLRVSVAIGLALNPTLNVLLIRSGNLLDEDSLNAVAAQAEEAGAQIWMEWVTSGNDEVGVMIEEGRVK